MKPQAQPGLSCGDTLNEECEEEGRRGKCKEHAQSLGRSAFAVGRGRGKALELAAEAETKD